MKKVLLPIGLFVLAIFLVLSQGNALLFAAEKMETEGMQVPAHHLIAGVPGRIIKPLSDNMRQHLKNIPADYVGYQDMFPDYVHDQHT